jgi:hypothetical protein
MSSCIKLRVEEEGARWLSVKNMNVKRHSAAAASISSTQVRFGVRSELYGVYGYNFMQFVVCGGRGGNEADLDSVEAYSSTPNFENHVVY